MTTAVTTHNTVELSDFAAIVDGGPYLSLYLPTDSAIENAAQRVEDTWKITRRDLLAHGVPEETVALVDPLIADAHLKGETLAVIANRDHIVLEEHLPEPFIVPRDEWGPVADVIPILKARQARIPVVLAWIDDDGADIIGHLPTGRMIDLSDDDDSGDLGRRITRLAHRLDARLVILGGEIRTIHTVAESIPREIPVSLIEFAPNEPAYVRDEEVRRLVNTAVAEDTVAILEEWKHTAARTEGIAPTMEALGRGKVDVLLVPDDRELLAGKAAIVDGLVRDAILTGATVRVVPASGPVHGGVGAILRTAS